MLPSSGWRTAGQRRAAVAAFGAGALLAYVLSLLRRRPAAAFSLIQPKGTLT